MLLINLIQRPFRIVRKSSVFFTSLLSMFFIGSVFSSLAIAETRDPNKTLRQFQHSCRICHTDPASRAPKAFIEEEWDYRLEKGIDELLSNTLYGYGDMPALGMCTDCTPADFKALILFMANQTDEK